MNTYFPHLPPTKLLRRALLLLLVMVAWSATQAQLHVGIGGQAGFTNLSNANAVVDHYNSQGFLVKRLRKPRFPFGLIYGAAYRSDGLLLELALDSKRARVSTESSDGGSTLIRRDVRFTLSSLRASGGYAVVDEPEFQLYLVGGIDLGYARYLTRTGNEATINRANYFLRRRESFLATTLSVWFTFRQGEDAPSSTTFAPYVQLPFTDFSFQDLNRDLNPLDPTAPTGELRDSPLNFGFVFRVDFDLLEILD